MDIPLLFHLGSSGKILLGSPRSPHLQAFCTWPRWSDLGFSQQEHRCPWCENTQRSFHSLFHWYPPKQTRPDDKENRASGWVFPIFCLSFRQHSGILVVEPESARILLKLPLAVSRSQKIVFVKSETGSFGAAGINAPLCGLCVSKNHFQVKFIFQLVLNKFK